MSPKGDVLDRLDRGVARAEGGLLVVILTLMVGLALTQLVLRKTMDFGFEWADVTIRQMVLWTGFVGGARATHEGRHIAIDALGRMLPPRAAAGLAALSALTAALVCAALVHIGWTFVLEEHGDTFAVLFGQAEGELPAIEDLPFDVVMPLGLGAAAFHFLVAVKTRVQVALGRRAPAEEAASPAPESSAPEGAREP
jgi:TRAP-type C4-dicarboxylate transport system permease small subunit